MKIHSTNQSISRPWRVNRSATRTLLLCGAVALCVLTCCSASAQTASGVRNGLFINGNDSYQVVNTAAFRTAADVGTPESGSIAQVAYGSCGSCGTTSCGGACGYSSYGSFGGSCGDSCNTYNNFGNPCAPCQPYSYVIVEALYLELTGKQRLTYSRDFLTNDFDYEWAPRITIGSVPDCVHGCEATFMGPYEWEKFGQAFDAGFGLGTILTPGLPVAAANLSAFNNADYQNHIYTADYWSLELNKTTVGWDIAKIITGVRYVNYEERFSYYSQNATEAGLLFSQADNRLFGLQVGMDLLYPIARHAYTDFRSRFVALANFAESKVRLDNAGVRVLSTADDKTRIAGMIEIGSGVRYEVGQALSVRAGVEMMYLTRVASAPGQFTPVIRPQTGLRTRVKDDVLLAGLSVGATLKW